MSPPLITIRLLFITARSCILRLVFHCAWLTSDYQETGLAYLIPLNLDILFPNVPGRSPISQTQN